MRRRRPGALGLFLAGLSGLALFAFACFPLLAYAEGSIEGEYKDAPPTAEGKTLTPGGGGTKPPSHGDGALGRASSANPSPGSNKSHSSGQNQPSQSGGAPATGNHNGSHQGDRNGQQEGNAQPKQPTAQPGNLNAVPASSHDSGSSPLLPIAIAILVLAAISIAAVLMRQRRQRSASGQPISPKAG